MENIACKKNRMTSLEFRFIHRKHATTTRNYTKAEEKNHQWFEWQPREFHDTQSSRTLAKTARVKGKLIWQMFNLIICRHSLISDRSVMVTNTNLFATLFCSLLSVSFSFYFALLSFMRIYWSFGVCNRTTSSPFLPFRSGRCILDWLEMSNKAIDISMYRLVR